MYGQNQNGNVNTQFFNYFQKEYPNQFKKLQENDFNNYTESKVRKVEIWTWNPTKGVHSTAESVDKESLLEFVPDILIDQSKQAAKQNPMYQQMSPENILSQNIVFNVPLTMPVQKLEESLKITGTFVKLVNVGQSLQKLESRDTELNRNGSIQDIISKNSEFIELYTCDSIVIPALSKTSSYNQTSDDRQDEAQEDFVPVQNLPIL